MWEDLGDGERDERAWWWILAVIIFAVVVGMVGSGLAVIWANRHHDVVLVAPDAGER